ncbi:hypothetical protein [Zavarzinia aquatilis]|uniref:Uncharacterized protein n=1 Tax=Zavarzinia aquatilis TaxID=2211142 RepID=A0A317EDB4_9PROT|nr:hypothetical protein [Zavarzinia aquatilis]PWR24582.1 hypothetical protein DKG74_07190 [Zavarzinia aquatilis]
MSVYIDEALAAALADPAARFGIFFRCQGDTSATSLRLWSGVQARAGEMRSGAVVVAGAEDYIGLGVLLDAPDIDHIVDGTADDVSFRLSGVPPTVEAYVAGGAVKVRGRRVNLGLMAFNRDWSPVTPIIPVAQYTASHLSISSAPGDGPAAPNTVTLTLVCKNGDTSRSRGQPLHWVPNQWKALHEGSTFTNLTPRYQRGATVTWPTF